jgi:hypothetical protein
MWKNILKDRKFSLSKEEGESTTNQCVRVSEVCHYEQKITLRVANLSNPIFSLGFTDFLQCTSVIV